MGKDTNGWLVAGGFAAVLIGAYVVSRRENIAVSTETFYEKPDLSTLDDDFAADVAAVIASMEAQGYDPVVFEAQRSYARQLYLMEGGKSWVSDPTDSKHYYDGTNTVKAVDIISAEHGWDSEAFFDALAETATEQGLTSGHYWSTKDSAHIEVSD